MENATPQSQRQTGLDSVVNIPYENPLKTARKELNLSLHQLSVKAGVSRQVIIRAEHGMYKKIPKGILDYFAKNNLAYGAKVFYSMQYTRWQTAVRKANRERLKDFPIYLYRHTMATSSVGVHPFAYWLDTQHIATTYFGRLFCLPSALLVRFLNQDHLYTSLPEELRDALIDAGFDRPMVDDLDAAFKEYREYTRGVVFDAAK